MIKLAIADKAYSSWSLRAWLILRQPGIPFEEIRLRFGSPTWQADFRAVSPTGKVPVLVLSDGHKVWESLAIAETLAELFPEKALWPKDPTARAWARSISAEMHAGFGKLRANLPMHLLARLPGRGWNLAVQQDVDRICAIWTECLQAHGGPLLFGDFTVADAMFAPVVTRLQTYEVAVPAMARAYMDRVLALPAMLEWTRRAAEEFEFVDFEEPYRAHP
jgi:glutathione S-transferase